jgi:hypothetical protein
MGKDMAGMGALNNKDRYGEAWQDKDEDKEAGDRR